MADETALKMYESARDKLRELLRQEIEAKEQVRDRMAEMGYDLSKYKHEMPPIHNTLKRMKEAGEIREVEAVWGDSGEKRL